MAVIKGHSFDVVIAKDSFDRRALQYKNRIIATLKVIGITEDYIDVPLERVAIKKAAASVTFYVDGNQLHFSYLNAGRYVDNLYVISKVLELEVASLISGEKTINDFIKAFSEEGDIKKERKAARETLGLAEDVNDLEAVNKQFKTLSKEHHPDMPNGDHEKFKEINRAHKILKRELE
jgi:hypothetical protein